MSSPSADQVVHVNEKSGMIYTNLGNSGIRVSKLSFGSWLSHGGTVHGDPVYQTLKIALEGGINFFDNAEVYAGGKAELSWGEAFKKLGTPRDEVVITTKLYFGNRTAHDRPVNGWGLSRKHIVEGIKASLERLQLEYVDVVLAHRPDVATPLEETVRAFNHIIEKGQALYWGTSEWTALQVQEAILIADRLNLIRPIVEQPHYSLLHRTKVEGDYLPLFEKYGYGTMIWSPLESGLLTGKYRAALTDENFVPPKGSRFDTNKDFFADTVKSFSTPEGKAKLEKIEKFIDLAEGLGTTPTRLALAWTIKNPNVSTAILGATTPEQLADNLKALEVLPLVTDDVLAKLDAIFDNKPEAALTYGRA